MSTNESKPLALVTGGSGFFGCLLVQYLREYGYRVRVFDLVDVPDRAPDVEFVRGDIRDAAAVRTACEGVGVVHHNVAQVPLAKDRRLFDSVNVEGTRVLARECLRAHVSKMIYVSSSAVFGAPRSNPVGQNTRPQPAESYGRAKYEAEGVVADFIKQGLDASIIRPRTILGHGRLGIFQILFELVRKGRSLYVLGRGDNRYQFVHARDLGEACILAAEHPGPDTFNIGAGQFGTMRELLEGLVSHAGTSSKVRSVPMLPAVAAMKVTSRLGLSPLGPYHALMYGREMFFDTRPAQATLGWHAKFSNEQMICESYDYYINNRPEVLARSGASHHRSAVKMGILRLLEFLP